MNKTTVQQIVERLMQEAEYASKLNIRYFKAKAHSFTQAASIAAEFLEVEKNFTDQILKEYNRLKEQKEKYAGTESQYKFEHQFMAIRNLVSKLGLLSANI